MTQRIIFTERSGRTLGRTPDLKMALDGCDALGYSREPPVEQPIDLPSYKAAPLQRALGMYHRSFVIGPAEGP
jgi:hypothetical protein